MSSQSRQGRMMVAAIMVAICVFSLMAWKVKTLGTYEIKSLLISPKAIETMKEYHPIPDKEAYVFNRVEFEILDAQGGHWLRRTIPVEHYVHFYEAVVANRSVSDLSKEALKQFEERLLGRLIVTLRPKSLPPGTEGAEKNLIVFQEVQFASGGNLFRVSIKEKEGDPEKWAYFENSQISLLVIEDFLQR